VDAKEVGPATAAFACDLYGQLRQREGNLCFSPYDIAAVLALTALGADGETRAQIVKTLHLPADPTASAGAWKSLRDYLLANQGERTHELHIANALWGQKGVRFRKAFLTAAQDQFGAKAEALDFADQASARQTINRWAAEQTRGRIADLVPAGRLAPETRLVVTSAIAFRGRWAKPFKKGDTSDGDFHPSADRTMTVPMMHQVKEFPYAADDSVQLLEMPYAGSHLAMLVVLPRRIEGLAAVEHSLTADRIAKWTRKLLSAKLPVSIPRFRCNTDIDLKKPLEAIGMSLAFDPEKADFSKLTEAGNRLWIYEAGHAAFVEVDEEGTEAAVATYLAAKSADTDRKPPEFIADHPFLFLIRDMRTGCVLFLGQVANPKQ
jgi:serpin B